MKKKYLLSSFSLVIALLVTLSFQLNTYATTSSQSGPLLGNGTIHEIAFAVNDIDQATTDFGKLFGIVKPPAYPMEGFVVNSIYRGQPVGFDSKAAFMDTDTIQIEIIQPGTQKGTIRDYLENRGEGVHHIAIAVTDMEAKKALMAKEGFLMEQSGDIVNDGGSFAFVDTMGAYKAYLEMLEAKIESPFPPNQPSGAPLLGTTKIAHVGIVVNNLDEATSQYAKLLGLAKPPVVMEDRAKTAIFKTPTVDIELIEPDQTGNIWRKYLKSKGEGVHHLSFEVDNLDASVKKMQQLGYPLIQTGVSKRDGTKYAYVDTTSSFKVTIELLQKK